jgi:YesN/AraC family two-component response regulator
VLLKIRRDNPNVKFIITSGYIEPAMESEIDRARVKFLHKPYGPDDVFRTLQSLAESAP